MARKNGKPKDPAAKWALPDYITGSRVLQRRKVTKRQLPTFTEQMMLLHAPEAQRLFWQALLKGLERGDKDCMRMMGEIAELLKRGGGITVTQQILNQNAAAGETAPVVGFDAFARQLAEARAGHLLPSPRDVVDLAPQSTGGGQDA